VAKTSCITHSAGFWVTLLREDYLHICEGKHCAAILLSQFEHWHNIKLENREQSMLTNKKLQESGDKPTQITDLWVWKSGVQAHTELMGQFGENMVSTSVRYLIEKGFLQSRTNPYNTYDQTIQYLFDVDVVQEALDSLPDNWNRNYLKASKKKREMHSALSSTHSSLLSNEASLLSNDSIENYTEKTTIDVSGFVSAPSSSVPSVLEEDYTYTNPSFADFDDDDEKIVLEAEQSGGTPKRSDEKTEGGITNDAQKNTSVPSRQKDSSCDTMKSGFKIEEGVKRPPASGRSNGSGAKAVARELMYEFDHEFWPKYPRMDSKDKARLAYLKVRIGDKDHSAATLEEILEGLRRHAGCDQWRKDGGEYIPYAVTWLNQRRWEDTPGINPEYADAYKKSDPANMSGADKVAKAVDYIRQHGMGAAMGGGFR